MRIELLGASGSGKTTALATAAARRTTPFRWLAPADLASLKPQPPSAAELSAAIDDPALRRFVDHVIETVATGSMLPSQKLSAATILRRSCYELSFLDLVEPDRLVVHDELLLHRAFSVLPHASDLESARVFFELVPVPDVAVIFRAHPDVIVARVTARPSVPNVYRGLDGPPLRAMVGRSMSIADIAAEVLSGRGVDVATIDTTDDRMDSADILISVIDRYLASDAVRGSSEPPPTGEATRATRDEATPAEPDEASRLRERVLAASGSFRKKDGRHELRAREVAYCAFSTPRFSIRRSDAQRDATRRVANFGLTPANVRGRSVLDLGSNCGAMLFELSNFGPSAGLGIEYDAEKVELSADIAAYARLPNLQFMQGDIDQLDPEELGVHDIVLALAIEAHVNQPDRLYELLGTVTGDALYFEGNNNCDMRHVRERLAGAGFRDFVDLGFCDDDRDPRNNRRPQMVALKMRRPLLRRLLSTAWS
jgi:hypothetical protein